MPWRCAPTAILSPGTLKFGIMEGSCNAQDQDQQGCRKAIQKDRDRENRQSQGFQKPYIDKEKPQEKTCFTTKHRSRCYKCGFSQADDAVSVNQPKVKSEMLN